MIRETFDFKTGYYFPWTFLFLGLLMAVIGLALMVSQEAIIAGVFVFVGGIGILSTRYGLEVNKKNQQINEYISLLFFFTIHDKRQFENVHRVIINKSNISQAMTSYAGKVSTGRYEIYKAYMVVDEQEKIFIRENRKKLKLVSKIKPLVEYLETDLVDNTAME